MEQLSAQLYTAFASFVDASKAEIDQLKQHVAELDQKCTNLEQSNARLEKRSTEQQNVLAVLMRERKMTMERLDGTASKPEKQQSTMEKRSHVASPLQAKNTNRRAKTALSKELAAAADQPLPSRETTSDSQEFVTCAEPSSPRSNTFVGDEVPSSQLPTESQNLTNGTPPSRHVAGNADLPWMRRKRVPFSEDSFMSTQTPRVPQMRTRQSRSNKTLPQTEESTHAEGLTAATTASATDRTIAKDGSGSAKRARRDTTIKGSMKEHDLENTVVAHRSGKRRKATTHAQQLQGNTNESTIIDEAQPAYSELMKPFNTRTGSMQAATPLEHIDSEISEEPIAFTRSAGGRLRNDPRKSAWFRQPGGEQDNRRVDR